LVEISEFTSAADADIEDLRTDLHLDLVNRAYRTELSNPITPADLNPSTPKAVRQITAYQRPVQPLQASARADQGSGRLDPSCMASAATTGRAGRAAVGATTLARACALRLWSWQLRQCDLACP
jgi:hypothetical protein